MKFGRFRLATTISALITMVFAPIFSISRINQGDFLGVDIQTHLARNLFADSFAAIFTLAVLVFLLVSMLAKHYYQVFHWIVLISGLGFFTYYLYLFFTSLMIYFIQIIPALFNQSFIYLGITFIIMMILTIAFYIGGYITFIDELIKEKVYKKID